MTAVMMKADTRPARRGSRVGESCTTVVPSPTLSWDGVLAWALASALGLVVATGDSLEVSECVLFCFDAGGRGLFCVVMMVGEVVAEVVTAVVTAVFDILLMAGVVVVL